MNKKIIFLQLNEFNLDLLKKKAFENNLINLQKIFDLNFYQYECDAIEEHRGLDPWVQWVNINTGKKYDEHNLREMGESSNLKFNQIWDVLSDNNITTGVWGTMNAKNNNKNNNLVFLPDPWNDEQICNPKYLKNIFDLPSYMLKNFMDFSILKFLKLAGSFIFTLIRSGVIFTLIFKSFFILKFIAKKGINKYFLYSIFDWISFILFMKLKKKHKLDFSIFFINTLASSQHRVWNKDDKGKEIDFTFMVLDRIMAEIYNLKNEKIIIASGLSQKKLEYKYYHYRPKNPEKFFKKIGIEKFNLRQNMSNDGFLYFDNDINYNSALKIFSNLNIDNKMVFQFEDRLVNNQKCIFFILNVNHYIKENTYIEINEKKFLFYDFFNLDVIRTGEHTPICNTFTNIEFNKKNKLNCDIFDQIKLFYQI